MRRRWTLYLVLLAVVPLRAPTPAGATQFPPDIRLASDMDRDGLNDFYLVKRQPPSVHAHRGVDGRALWTRTDPGALSFVPRGPGGRPGLLFMDEREGVGSMRVASVTAVDADGRSAWTREFRFVSSCCPLGSELGMSARVGALLDANGDATDDVLVVVDGYLDAYRPETGRLAFVSALTPVILDGETGETLSATTIPDVGLRDWEAANAGDLDDDGQDDYLVVFGVSQTRVIAIDADDGVPLWDRSGAFGFYVPGVGDLTGDGVHEVVLHLRGVQPVGGPVVQTRVSVLDGAGGTTVWTVPGLDGAAYPLGDVDGDGMRDLGYQILEQDEGTTRIRYEAADGEGRLLYSTAYDVALEGDTILELQPDEGDVNGDGVPDPGHRLNVSKVDGREEDARIVSGASGVTLRDALFVPHPLRASVDGAGDDFAFRPAFGDPDGAVRVEDGSTGTPIWSRSFPGEILDGLSPIAHDLIGDARSEILVTLSRAAVWRILAIDPRTDATLWTLP